VITPSTLTAGTAYILSMEIKGIRVHAKPGVSNVWFDELLAEKFIALVFF
jgi:hypothetical protein